MKFCYNVIERDGDKDLLYQLDYDIDCPYLCGIHCGDSNEACIYADMENIVLLPSYNYEHCYIYKQRTAIDEINMADESDRHYGRFWFQCSSKYTQGRLEEDNLEQQLPSTKIKRHVVHIRNIKKFIQSHPHIRVMTVINNTKNDPYPVYKYLGNKMVQDNVSATKPYKKIKCLHCGKEVYSNTKYCFTCLQYENFESK